MELTAAHEFALQIARENVTAKQMVTKFKIPHSIAVWSIKQSKRDLINQYRGIKEHMHKYERHMEICRMLNDTYKVKNTAYGDSFGKTFQELGIISAITRMSDKFGRIKALATGAKNDVMDESLKDTLLVMANYCVMTLIEMEVKEGNESK